MSKPVKGERAELYEERFRAFLFRSTGAPQFNVKAKFIQVCEAMKSHYDDLREKYKDRFDFRRLDSVFSSFLAFHSPRIPSLASINPGPTLVWDCLLFEHEKVLYRASMERAHESVSSRDQVADVPTAKQRVLVSERDRAADHR